MGRIARLALAGSLLVLAIVLVGCGGGSNSLTSPDSGLPGTPRSSTGTVTFAVNWVARTRVVPEAAESLEIVLNTGNGVAALKRQANRPNTDDAISQDIIFSDVPAGDRRYTITAYSGKNLTGSVLGIANGIVKAQLDADVTVNVETVIKSAVSKLAIVATGETLLVKRGDELALNATATNTLGAVLPLGAHCLRWTSDDPTIAAVDADTGVVTGIKGGATIVTVTDQESGISDTIKIVVDDLIVKIKVTPLSIAYPSGDIMDPGLPTTATLLKLRVEASNGSGPYPSSVQVQWDWENDGAFDTRYFTDVENDHVYPTAGTHTVRVRAKDMEGRTAEATADITVVADANPVHVQGYAYSDYAKTTATAIYFYALASHDELDPYLSSKKILQGSARWDWDNDGAYDTDWLEFQVNPDAPDPAKFLDFFPFPADYNLSHLPCIEHTFATTGEKIVNVQIRDGYNRVGTDTIAITVDDDVWKP